MNKLNKKIYRGIKKIIAFILSFPILKIDNKKIVFDNFNGKGYGDNPKYIAEELIKEKVDCKIIWVVSNINEEIPKEIKKVKYGSIKSLWEYATAKVWIDNVRNYKGVKKKRNQFYIQTWHSAFGLKKVEAQIEESLPEYYIKDAKNDGKITDLMISNNSFSTERYKKYFWYSGEVLECGIPRNDILYNVSPEIKKKVYSNFNIPIYKKIILYAPTFRKNENIECYKFDFEKCCTEICKKFEDDFVMLVRLHPNVSRYENFIEYNDKVINATKYPDIQEILAVTSVGITDYSSISFDLSMIGRPVFLLCKDLQKYIIKERQVTFELNTLPFQIAENEEQLYKNISTFSEEKYQKECAEFYKDKNIINTDNASARVVKIIREKLK